MFVDVAKVKLKAGDGGNGAVSFHREKYVSSGGPDGGDGGKGGDIIFVADRNLATLADFRYKRKYIAKNGESGKACRSSGKSAPNLVIHVPKGTIVRELTSGKIIADISTDAETVIARGGKGGYGNMHFATPTRQAPRFAKPGVKGEELEVQLELKLLADVGLVGFPNVGKSTLISVISQAKPVVADYHFTTLTPVLGVVRMHEESSFVVADIPGLIEGACNGLGLGHQFLRHIERCRLLVHVVDIAGSEGRDPVEDFEVINLELKSFDEGLSAKPMIVAGNKCDLASDEQIERFKGYVEARGYKFFPIMAPINHGVEALLLEIEAMLAKLPPITIYEPEELPENLFKQTDGEIEVTTRNGVYFVSGEKVLRLVESVNLDDYESLRYFHKMLGIFGVLEKLKNAGIKQGDTVSIYDFEFEFLE